MMWVINHDEAQLSLPEVLCQKQVCLSKKQARKIIDQGRCSVNGITIRVASYTLRPHDRLSCIALPSESPVILYEDECFFAINKPAGLASDEKDLCERLKRKKLFLVHRLDKYTSGVLLIAKNPSVEAVLTHMFFERRIHKQYIALVHGSITQPREITLPLEEKERSSTRVIWGVAPPGRGRSASTRVEPILSSQKASYVQLFPTTGRTHQLRVHMAAIGHPILGDFVYGYPSSLPYYALHCTLLAFDHPCTQHPCSIRAEVPLFIHELGSTLFKNKNWLL